MTVTPIEFSVVAGAFFLFSFLPGVLTWIEAARQRRARVAELAVAAPTLGAAPPAAPAHDGETPPEVVAQEQSEQPQMSAPVVAESVSETPAVAAAPIADEGTHSFRLDDLRHARIVETPPREVLEDHAGQQRWEDGLALADKHRTAIGGAAQSASFEPQSWCFAGMRDLDEGIKELRFFLFPGLWPTAIDQAAGEAVFEFADVGLVKAYVVRRTVMPRSPE